VGADDEAFFLELGVGALDDARTLARGEPGRGRRAMASGAGNVEHAGFMVDSIFLFRSSIVWPSLEEDVGHLAGDLTAAGPPRPMVMGDPRRRRGKASGVACLMMGRSSWACGHDRALKLSLSLPSSDWTTARVRACRSRRSC